MIRTNTHLGKSVLENRKFVKSLAADSNQFEKVRVKNGKSQSIGVVLKNDDMIWYHGMVIHSWVLGTLANKSVSTFDFIWWFDRIFALVIFLCSVQSSSICYCEIHLTIHTTHNKKIDFIEPEICDQITIQKGFQWNKKQGLKSSTMCVWEIFSASHAWRTNLLIGFQFRFVRSVMSNSVCDRLSFVPNDSIWIAVSRITQHNVIQKGNQIEVHSPEMSVFL